MLKNSHGASSTPTPSSTLSCLKQSKSNTVHTAITMIRRPPTSLSVQESDVETLKAYRRAKMMQHNPNLTSSSFSSIRPDESGSIHDHHHHHARQESDEQEHPGTQPGLSQQENHNPNQPQNRSNNT